MRDTHGPAEIPRGRTDARGPDATQAMLQFFDQHVMPEEAAPHVIASPAVVLIVAGAGRFIGTAAEMYPVSSSTASHATRRIVCHSSHASPTFYPTRG